MGLGQWKPMCSECFKKAQNNCATHSFTKHASTSNLYSKSVAYRTAGAGLADHMTTTGSAEQIALDLAKEIAQVKETSHLHACDRLRAYHP